MLSLHLKSFCKILSKGNFLHPSHGSSGWPMTDWHFWGSAGDVPTVKGHICLRNSHLTGLPNPFWSQRKSLITSVWFKGVKLLTPYKDSPTCSFPSISADQVWPHVLRVRRNPALNDFTAHFGFPRWQPEGLQCFRGLSPCRHCGPCF